MVLAGKIFKVREKIDLDAVAAKLKNYREEESYTEGDKEFRLVTEFRDLSLRRNVLEGLYAQDKIVHIRHHGELVPVPKTIEAQFAFTYERGLLLLTVLEKKWNANNIANRLSEIIFATTGYIVEARIPQEALQRYHEGNPDGTKVIFFDEVDIPNVKKLSLYGPSLADTGLYSEYLKHGSIWYIVITSKRYGHIVGITRDGIVTIFNRLDPSGFFSYVAEEIYPLVE
ncbi:MAG: hypothetical protein QXJ75_00755 [Candidatus Bathyarchaeia archaeon]